MGWDATTELQPRDEHAQVGLVSQERGLWARCGARFHAHAGRMTDVP